MAQLDKGARESYGGQIFRPSPYSAAPITNKVRASIKGKKKKLSKHRKRRTSFILLFLLTVLISSTAYWGVPQYIRHYVPDTKPSFLASASARKHIFSKPTLKKSTLPKGITYVVYGSLSKGPISFPNGPENLTQKLPYISHVTLVTEPQSLFCERSNRQETLRGISTQSTSGEFYNQKSLRVLSITSNQNLTTITPYQSLNYVLLTFHPTSSANFSPFNIAVIPNRLQNKKALLILSPDWIDQNQNKVTLNPHLWASLRNNIRFPQFEMSIQGAWRLTLTPSGSGDMPPLASAVNSGIPYLLVDQAKIITARNALLQPPFNNLPLSPSLQSSGTFQSFLKTRKISEDQATPRDYAQYVETVFRQIEQTRAATLLTPEALHLIRTFQWEQLASAFVASPELLSSYSTIFSPSNLQIIQPFFRQKSLPVATLPSDISFNLILQWETPQYSFPMILIRKPSSSPLPAKPTSALNPSKPLTSPTPSTPSQAQPAPEAKPHRASSSFSSSRRPSLLSR